MINLWLAIIAVAASVAAAFLPVFRGIRIPILAFLLAYGVTVVAGAGFLFDESGQAQLRLHTSIFSAASFTTLGAPPRPARIAARFRSRGRQAL